MSGRPEVRAPVKHPVSQTTPEEPNSLHPATTRRSPRTVIFPEGDHPGMECGHLTILCAAETTPCMRPQESLRSRVAVTRGTGALSLQQGHLGAWREGDHDILFRYLFLMQINNSQTIRTNTFIIYSSQHESTSYIYELIYPHKKSVRINFTDGETKGT